MDNIEVIDLKAKFIDFYEIANNKEITRDKRLDLWERKYNFAAVPPGEQGRKLARKLFEEAWDKYEENMDIIKNWRLDIEKIQHYLNMIKLQLGYEGCIDLVIIYFVGFFENNAFTAPYGEERIAICLPIETNTDDILLVHELTHVVHNKTANLSLEWERTIAEIILSEGLALHLSKTLVPGYSDESYTEFSNGWLKMCAERKNDISMVFIHI